MLIVSESKEDMSQRSAGSLAHLAHLVVAKLEEHGQELGVYDFLFE